MTLNALDAQIAALHAKRQAMLAEADRPWPKRVTLCAYTRREASYDVGQALGLTGEALRFFASEDELTLEYAVQQDGRATLMSCNGHPLPQKGA